MKDQITVDLMTSGAKLTPPAVVATATAVGQIDPNSALVWLTIIYTLSMLLTNMIRSWGMWMEWWAARWGDVRKFWRWLRHD